MGEIDGYCDKLWKPQKMGCNLEGIFGLELDGYCDKLKKPQKMGCTVENILGFI